ncbi:MAG: LuxR C-terminal-related transcriptional regulator [Gemmatimonadota bacterium]
MGEDLDRLAMCAYLVGREEGFRTALERAHHSYLANGKPLAAARAAFWIGMHLAERGETGPASGWLGRAGRLVEEQGGESVERGYLLLAAGYRHFSERNPDAAHDSGGEAVQRASRFGDRDLLALALHLQGRALLRQLRVPEGLRLLDEAMVAVVSDELSPMVTGLIYCSVISACGDVCALGRAHQWTEALRSWCERQPDLVAYTDQCRVHRAEVMQLHGAWRDSIDEARHARDGAVHGILPGVTAASLYQEGEAHRLMGELAAAEEAYRGASRLGREPQPGLALLRLAQGDQQGAAAATRRALAEKTDPLARARLLPAHVEILLAVGDTDEAARASEELETLARSVGTDYLEAAAAHARGAVKFAGGDAAAACVALRAACQGWRALEAPYHAARAMELLGLACGALNDQDAASLELDAARTLYTSLGARADLSRLDDGGEQGRAHGLTPRELEVLALVATGKTNRSIAGELFISEKTVARHVSNIFSKLSLSTRAAATAYAYEHDLIHPPA